MGLGGVAAVSVSIDAIRVGITNTYVIRDRGAILIDPGEPGKGKIVLGKLAALPVRPEDIRLMVVTHGHFDHIGAASKLREVTGARIAIHRDDAHWIRQGVVTMPGGVTPWGRFLYGLTRAVILPFLRVAPVEPDLVLEEDGLSLKDYGIAGKVVHTPGHSPGSMSVLLDTGDVFVGDMAMNGFPFCRKPSLPIFADDPAQVRESWRRLLNMGARVAYPAHGRPFPADALREVL